MCLEQEADEAKFGEIPLVGAEHALDEGKSILWVLFDVMLNVLLDVFLFVLDQQPFWQITILLKADLLLCRALKQWPSVAVEQDVKEGCVLTHERSLEHLVQRFLLLRFILVSFTCHFNRFFLLVNLQQLPRV